MLVKKAACQAQVSTFIEECPDGYNSYVGERGVRLSGVTKLVLHVSHKQAQVLVLDEATSALDSATEQAVIHSMDRLSNKPTIIDCPPFVYSAKLRSCYPSRKRPNNSSWISPTGLIC